MTSVIVGIDEAGRGALAGPVVAGACVLRNDFPPFIRDSKQLDAIGREEAFAWIEGNTTFGWGAIEADDIDAHGILHATESAMNQAVRMLTEHVTPTYLLVDGRDKFWFDYPHSSVIRGDESEPCISAASIVAKVTRDRMMTEHARTFAAFGFDAHKGYGTPHHIAAILKHGPCSLHRTTFLRNIISDASTTISIQQCPR